MTDDEVERVAEALYRSQDCARSWSREPRLLQERFLNEARAAILMLDEHRGALCPYEIPPLVVEGDLRAQREFFMNSQDISLMPRSTFRTVLRGPGHAFDVANDSYFRLVGARSLLNVPLREALPDLEGQGYYELVENVFTSKVPFVGGMLPLRLQAKPGTGAEEHVIDLIYRPIVDPGGRALGLFVEGRDRTEGARS